MSSDLTNNLSTYLLWPEKFDSGCRQAEYFFASKTRDKIKNVKRFICVGMGGSIASGQILQAIVENHLNKEFVLAVDPFFLPKKFTKNDLFILISHSGNTWEIEFVFQNLKKLGANIFVLSCGGRLIQQAEVDKVNYCKISAGDAPREDLPIFLGFLLSMVLFFKKNGGDAIEQVRKAICESIQFYGKAKKDSNFLNIFGKVDAFHIFSVGRDSYLPSVRARNQFAENAKVNAFVGVIPDVCHNVLATFQEKITTPVLFFHTQFLDPRLEKIIICLKKLLSESGVALYSAPILGNNWIGQMISLVVWADFASVWLAEFKGYDPRSIVLLNKLKQEIGKNILI